MTLDLEHVDPRSLVPWERNPRVNDPAVPAVARSIERFGFGAPVVARPSDRRVLAGHTRLKAALSLGLDSVPVRWLELADGEADAFALADNRLGELAEWDDAGLAAVLADLRAEQVEVADLGWSEAELDALCDPGKSVAAVGEDRDEEDEDELEEAAVSGLPPVPEGAEKVPFPWFGGKRRVAGAVWQAFGDVALYVEPFAGSLACILARPREHQHSVAAVNDADGYVANFWRAMKGAPDEVARWADDPVNEVDMLARHRWLVSSGRERLAALEADPEFCDPKVAGWWCWGLAAWIGSGWCSAEARWAPETSGTGLGVHRQLPHVGSTGLGVHRQLPSVDGTEGGACAEHRAAVIAWFRALADRLRNARVCCGDWTRVCTLGATAAFSSVGVFIDPPYGGEAVDRGRCYAVDDMGGLSARARNWALGAVADPRFRIALCGYEEEHGPHMPATWRKLAWATKGAYQRRASAGTTRSSKNRFRERIWFSPSCLPVEGAR